MIAVADDVADAIEVVFETTVVVGGACADSVADADEGAVTAAGDDKETIEAETGDVIAGENAVEVEIEDAGEDAVEVEIASAVEGEGAVEVTFEVLGAIDSAAEVAVAGGEGKDKGEFADKVTSVDAGKGKVAIDVASQACTAKVSIVKLGTTKVDTTQVGYVK